MPQSVSGRLHTDGTGGPRSHAKDSELQGLPNRMQGQLLHVAKVTGQRVAVNAQTASDRC